MAGDGFVRDAEGGYHCDVRKIAPCQPGSRELSLSLTKMGREMRCEGPIICSQALP